jgi:hypothetical protein
MADDRKGPPRAPRSAGRRTTLRVPEALASVVDDMSRELGISRNDALLRLATRGARIHEEARKIEAIRAARWAAVVGEAARGAGGPFPSPEEAREAVMASRDLF